jgi:hypothetical protein
VFIVIIGWSLLLLTSGIFGAGTAGADGFGQIDGDEVGGLAT